ncbi:MAG: DUF4859 domain-containing protein [Bacteroidaceae bacterium]|nr:DUF4859 domain-containing protein [Bacteroidaceae bacterium]
MKKVLLTMLTMLCIAGSAYAYNELRAYNSSTGEKGIYYPSVWTYNSSTKEYAEGSFSYSMSRKRESANFVVFWSSEYGTTAPDALSTSDSHYVDVDDLLVKAEAYYTLYATTMGFVNPTTSTTMSKYKCMILLYNLDEWAAYGGGYDFVIPALWISPSTCKPVGHTIAHEIGHSFHYMAFAESNNHQDSTTDNTGFHLACGNGQCIWEQTAQFQAATAEPSAMFTESFPLFGNNANYAFSHEWMRYQSYWFHFYLNQYYNDPAFVGKVWNQPMKNQQNGSATDFCQAYIKLKGLTAAQFYERYFDYALHCATFDFDAAAARPDRDNYIGKFDYHAVMLGANKYQVAYQSCPQSTGFNVIELSVPSSGTTITTKFTALQHGCSLADGDPALYNNGEANASVSAGVTNYNNAGTASYRGFRVGYVFLKSNGTREYYNDNTVHCTGTAVATENISTTVPANTSRIFLVVSPALTTYVKHPWQEDITKDDQWPYQFELENVTAKSVTPIIQEPEFTKAIDGRSISDVTLTYNVVLPPTDGYDGATVTFTGSGLNALCTAFQMEGDNIFNNAVGYASSQSNGSIMNYAVAANGNLQSAASNTNGDFGHWFNTSGTVVDWGNSTVAFAEFTKSTKSAVIGQFPGASSDGQTRTIREALVYKKSATETATAYLIFNITFQSGLTSGYAYLSDINYTEPPVSSTTVTAYRGYKVNDISLQMEQGASKSYPLTDTDKSDLIYYLGYTTTTTYNTFAGYFKGYNANISSASSSTNVYYYALPSAPTATSKAQGSLVFYNAAASTTDSEYSGQYVHYYDETGACITNSSNAKFKVAYDRASATFTVKAADDCPVGTYTIYIGMARRYGSSNQNRIYVAYFPITITVTAPVIYNYIINVAEGAPAGAGFTTQNGLTGSGNTYSITDTEITATNVADYVTATPVSGYASEITMSGTTITITYTATGETLNVERYTGQGYTASSATVDFTAAKAYLGVSEVTTDMLRIINPDESVISDYAGYDGWFATDGTAKTWSDLNAETEAADKAGICVKFFQAVSGGTYEICDMNGADVVGTTYTVKWALMANSKTYIYTINVTFAAPPAAEFDFDDLAVQNTMNVNLTSTLGSSYEGLTSDVDVSSILSTLNVASLDDLTIYAVQSDGSLDDNYQLGGTDGWRNAVGDWQGWGNDARFCVKADFTAATEIYYVGGMDGQTSNPATYTAKYAFVKNGSSTHDAVVLNVNLIYPSAIPVVEYNYTIYAQSRETESLRITLNDAAVESFGLTWDQVRTKLTDTHTANSNSIGVANHTLATNEVMLYPANYASGDVDQTKSVNWADNGHWFNDTGFVQDANDGEIAIALDWIGSSWVIYQKVNTLTAGDEYEVANALLYNDGTETKQIVFKFHITVAALDNVILADTQTSYEQHTGNCNVTLQRSLAAGKWLTFCAPFNIGAGEWEGMGISEVQRLTGVTYENNCVTFNFSDVTDGIWVGIPYIIKMSETKTGITKTETGYGAYSDHPTTTVEAPTGDCTAQMIGTYVKISLPNDVYYISDDRFYHTNYTGTNVTNMKGWRAYFTITTNSEVKSMAYQIGEKVEEPTAIEGLDVLLNDRVDVFTISGQKVKGGVQRLEATEGLPAGIYIVGGKKVMVR